MVTGHSTEQQVKEARDAGVNEFLAKPVTARGVLERIHKVMDHARTYVRSDDSLGRTRRRKQEPGSKGPKRRAQDQQSDDTPQA